MRIVAFDLETTGLSPATDRVVEFCFTTLTPDLTVEEEWTDRVDPGTAIPEAASQVHGITRDDVKRKPGFAAYAPGIQSYIEDAVLVAYNAAFDVPFLHAALQRCGEPGFTTPLHVVDPYHLCEHCFDAAYSLETAYKQVTGNRLTAAHSAAVDVSAAVTVLRHQLEALGVDVEDVVREVDTL